MTADERRVKVAAEALHLNYCREARCVGPEPDDYNAARAVVAALDAHDGDLRERLAGEIRWWGELADDASVNATERTTYRLVAQRFAALLDQHDLSEPT